MLFVRLILVFFFFKQKTAYEMRISDWSSDVCSSDLPIFMRTNGVHTSIVVPAASEGIDWRPLLRAGHIGRPDLAGDYLAIGWGREIFSADAGMGRSSSRRRAPRAGDRKSTRLNSSH